LKPHLVSYALRIYLPLLVLGGTAGFVHAVARSRAERRQRRLYDLLWILMLLLGAPAWLFVAAALGWL
jgi:hypothetical protein